MLAALAAALLAGAAADPCAGLVGATPLQGNLAGVRIDRLTRHDPASPLVAPDRAVAPVARPACRVEGTIDTEIGFELWLPADWNGRLLVGGVGGQAGQLNYRELARGLARGYASASTDSGHKTSDRHWLLNRPDRARNYAGEANHRLAVTAKALIARAYARPADHAFFVGCSGGGRQALTEVQRYPADFDGVIAGAPGVNTPAMSARRLWEMLRHSEWGDRMTDVQWRLVADAAVALCDGDDGVTDGIIADPRRCGFRPESLACTGAAGPGCLTPEQLAAVKTLYAPLHDETARRIDDGILPGVRVQRAMAPEPFTPGPPYLAVALFGDGVHADPNWDARNFVIARDLPAIDQVMDLHADNPAIEPFVSRGGRLILYHGWADPLVSPLPTIAYWQAVRERLGAARADRAVRLFMAPGVEHCIGGPGPDRFGGAGGDAPLADAGHDLLSALEAWVLDGRAPERIVATGRTPAGAPRTRPLCAWPRAARWNGRGDSDDAASFDCVESR